VEPAATAPRERRLLAVIEQRSELGEGHVGGGEVPLREIPSRVVLDRLERGALLAQAPLQRARMHRQRIGHLGVAARARAQQPFDHRAHLDRD